MAAESYLERELKFDLPAGFVLPDLAGVSPQVSRVDRSVQWLRSEYYDTSDHALRQAHITLRRRTGDADSGWHLKVPHPPAREEIRLPLDGAQVPDELAGLLFGVRRGQPLRPVAVIETERTASRLLDPDGRELAEVADDLVHASAAGEAATASSWREIEVELGTGDERLLAEIAGLLRREGATPAASASKLSRALADSAAAELDDPGALRAYLVEQQRALLAGDLELRRGHDAAIHKTRVATRRFRSTLRIFGQLLDSPASQGLDYQPASQRLDYQPASQGLDEELRWYAGVLGEVRDRQVQRAKLLAALEELDETEVLGPVRARIERTLTREQAEHWVTLEQALTGERYLQLLDSVNRFVQAVPAEARPKELRRLMRKADRKVRKRLSAAGRAGDPELLHRARKAAKRARYAGELVQLVDGKKVAKKAAQQAARNEQLQELLGEHQDCLVGAQLLRRLGAAAGTTPDENGFSYGVLYQRQLQRAAELRAAAAWSGG